MINRFHHCFPSTLLLQYMSIFFSPGCVCAFPDLSRGSAVQARLWEVPAEICWIATPSSPTTFLGLVMGPVEFPCPHWPMELFPHAYTSLSKDKRKVVTQYYIIRHSFNTSLIICSKRSSVKFKQINQVTMCLLLHHRATCISLCFRLKCLTSRQRFHRVSKIL